jgi:hypothetical protein
MPEDTGDTGSHVWAIGIWCSRSLKMSMKTTLKMST